MAKIKEHIRYEDAAYEVTVTGWACKRCKRWWGASEHMARYCCSTDAPCKCGGRKPRDYTHCEDCRSKERVEKWYAKEPVEWDGSYPIAVWDNDRYFFSEDELYDYLDDVGFVEGELDETVWLTTCRPNNGRHFEMTEFLCDDLAEDDDGPDASEIEAAVNKWIDEHAPYSWRATGERLSIKSVADHLGLNVMEDSDG